MSSLALWRASELDATRFSPLCGIWWARSHSSLVERGHPCLILYIHPGMHHVLHVGHVLTIFIV